MAEFGVEGAALKKMLKAAKKGPIAFGFNPGKSEEDAYLGMHRTKSPEALGKDAKEMGEGGKFASGMGTLKGKEFEVRCERVVPGLAKKLKKYLKSQKVMVNVIVMDADGNILESDIEDDLPDDPELAGDEEEGAAPPAGEAEGAIPPAPPLPPDGAADTAATEAEIPVAPPQPPDTGPIMKRLAALRDQIKELAPDLQTRLAAPFKQVVEQARAFDIAGAEAGATRIEQALKGLADKATGAPPPPSPELLKLAQMVQAMRPRAEALADPRIKDAVMKALEVASAHIKAQDVDATVAILKKLQDIFKSQQAAAPTAPPVGDDRPAAGAEIPTAPPLPNAEAPENAVEEEPTDAEEEEELQSPEAQEWENRYGAISGDIFLALSQGLVADVGELRKLNNYATDCAADGDFTKALATLTRIEAMLEAGRTDGKSAFEAEIPADAKPFAEARLVWARARGTMMSEVNKIAAAIVSEAADDEDLQAAAANVSALADKVKVLDERLEDALDLIVNAEPAARPPLKADARKVIDDYNKELATPFFADIDTNTGFGSVAVASTARAALSQIDAVLKAA